MSDIEADPTLGPTPLDVAIAEAMREPDHVITFKVTLPVSGIETQLRQRLVGDAIKQFGARMGAYTGHDSVTGTASFGAATITWEAHVPKKYRNLLHSMELDRADASYPAKVERQRNSDAIADERASRGNST